LQGGHQNPVKLPERLFEKDNVVQVRTSDAALLQAKLDGLFGKAVVVLDAGKAFFLRGGNLMAVTQQNRGRIMVVARNSQDIH
jgi:hypothetical protein